MATVLIPNQPEFLDRLAVQPDAPHLAQHELEMLRQTQALWYRCTPTRHSWGFPDPNFAPKSSIVATNTWTDFNVTYSSTSAQWQVPWLYHEDGESVSVLVYYCAPVSCPITVRARSGTLIDAVATVNSTESLDSSSSVVEPIRAGAWKQYQPSLGYYGITRTILRLVPTVPSSRRVQLNLQARWNASTFPSNTSPQYDVLVFAVMAWDNLVEAGQ